MPESLLSLRRTVGAPSEARERMRRLAALHLSAEQVEDAVLLVSELVTNAVKYGPEHGEIQLIVDMDETRMRVTVHDTGAGPLPEMRPLERLPHEGGGHGLRLVDRVSDRWGVERGSTRVWFELDL
jgi:anti-sigma regulatory factor (Ser/Thr protein kinase)